MIGVDADASVFHAKAQIVAVFFIVFADFNYHFTSIGKFNGIGNQVGQNLTDTGGIPFYLKWHIVFDMGDQLDVFLFGAMLKQINALTEHGADIERGDIQFHIAGFDFGIIQYVVQNLQQVVARRADGAYIIFLRGRQRRIF